MPEQKPWEADMKRCIRSKDNTGLLLALLACLFLISQESCSLPSAPFTIGMVNDVSIREPAIDGFKTGMAGLGYVEGKDIQYLYKGITGSTEDVIDAEIKQMLSRKVDILLAFGNAVAFRAKKLLEGTDLPIIVVAIGSPVESGLAESISRPGGNLTGLQIFETSLKGLEWLKTLSPTAKKVFLPFDAADSYSYKITEKLKKSAADMRLELVTQPVRTADEAAAAIENLPADIDAIFRTSTPDIDPETYKLSQAAIHRRLPTVASISLDEDVLLTCASSIFEMGKQAAHFAHQVRLGYKPGELPIETAEVMISVNLKTAEKIGFHVPDDILLSAKKIIR